MPRMCSDREIIDMYAGGDSSNEISRVLHTSLHRVRNLVTPHYRKCTDKQIIDMYAEGHSKKHICRILHTGHTRVIKLVGRMPKRDKLGEEIEKLFRKGLSEKGICGTLKISNVRVQAVVCSLLAKLSEIEIAKIVETHVTTGRKPAYIARNIRVDKNEVMRLLHLAQGYDNIEYFDCNYSDYSRCNGCGAKVIMPCLACQIRRE